MLRAERLASPRNLLMVGLVMGITVRNILRPRLDCAITAAAKTVAESRYI